MLTKNHSPALFNPTLNTLKLFMSINKFKVSYYDLFNSFSSLTTLPEISLKNINTSLQDLGLDPIVCKVSIDTLKQLELPILAQLDVESFSKYVIINEVSELHITFFDYTKVLNVLTHHDFLKIWNGVVIDVGGKINNKAFVLSYKNEIKERNSYLKEFVIIEDFFDTETCEFIINYADKNSLFTRSAIYSEDESLISGHRTSFSAFIRERLVYPISTIFNKVSILLSIPENFIECIQCVRYEKNQEFKLHFDDDTGHRKHTFLVYLNDDFEGGETLFPQLDLLIKPKKGKAILFKNLDEDKEILRFSLHAGLPVSSGVKYACNIWVNNDALPYLV